MSAFTAEAISEPDDLNWCYGPEVPVPAMGGDSITFVFESYAESTQRDALVRVANTFAAAPKTLLEAAEPFLAEYLRDCNSDWALTDDEYIHVATPSDVWSHVHLPEEVHVTERDETVYLVIEANCDWEPEHGLMLVFDENLQLVKLGPYDGHVTNEHAFADPSLRGVVYRRRSS